MAQEKEDNSNNQEPSTLSEAKIILAFLKCRLDEREEQLVASRKETENALKTRQALADTLAFCLKDHGATSEHYRQDIVDMRMRLENREDDLRTLQIQLSTVMEQILRDRERIVQVQVELAQFTREDQARRRHQQGQREPVEAQQVPEGPMGTPSEEPDFGGSLIDFRSAYDADLPSTVIQEEWVAGSPSRPDVVETAVEQHLDGSPGPSGTNNISGTTSSNTTNGTPGQVATDPSGTSLPSQEIINWEDYIGLNSNLDRAVEYDNDSEVPTEPFTPSETEQIYRRYYPHLLKQRGDTVTGEAQGNEAGQASTSEEQPETAKNADGEKGKRKAVNQGEASEIASGSESSDAKVKGKADTPTSGTTAGEGSTRGSRSGIVHPAPTVLRTGLHLPTHLEGETTNYNAQEAHGLPVQTYDHFVRHERAPGFFEFRIQFDPPVGSQHHFRRTVHIGNLPAHITLQALMESVRGGTVLRASLLNTVPITRTLSALVTFVEPEAAVDYTTFASIYPIRFFGSVATVTLITTPNFPMSYYLDRAVKSYNQTRVLRLDGIPPSRFSTDRLLDNLDLERASRLGLIESICQLDNFTVDLTFASVDVALCAYSAFLTNGAFCYLNAHGTFLPDPCAEPLETLLRQQAEMYGGLQDTPEGLYDLDTREDAYDDTEMSDYKPSDGFLNTFRPPSHEPLQGEPMGIEDEDATLSGDDLDDNGGEGRSIPYVSSAAEVEYLSLDELRVQFPCPAISHSARSHETYNGDENEGVDKEEDGEGNLEDAGPAETLAPAEGSHATASTSTLVNEPATTPTANNVNTDASTEQRVDSWPTPPFTGPPGAR